MFFAFRKYLAIIFVWMTFQASAQNRANIWQLGNFGILSCGIDFNKEFADTFPVSRKMNIFITNASICDTNGQLLFYTNGVWIANRDGDSLYGTENFNPGTYTDFYNDDGLGFPQGAVIIPQPGNNNQYLIFYVTAENIIAHCDTDLQPLYLSYSKVDMSLDSGMGGILSDRKNVHIVNDTISQGRITACRHANGRDWWVVIHKYYSDIYYKILVEPDTMVIFEQSIGNKFTGNDIDGMAEFSPDGTQYANLNINDTVDLLQFDRCTGEFSDPRYLIVPASGNLSATIGCSFSPNGRYLYANSYLELWQFDTWAADPNKSRILIDSITIDSIFFWFFINQLAPDNKIYIATFGSTYKKPVLHVIDQPDSLGTKCHFIYDGFNLCSQVNNSGIPNFPNYDLGPLIGSGCDTIVTAIRPQHSALSQFKLNPNPANSYFNITYQTDANATLEITDLFGREVMHATLYPYFKNRIFYTNALNDGMYVVTLKTKEGQASKKLIVEK